MTALTRETVEAMLAGVVCQLLRYEPETGRLFWRPRSAAFFADTPKVSAAGQASRWNAKHAEKETFLGVNKLGYRVGKIFRRHYSAHRVIWVMQTGAWPAGEVDHADTDPANNRWDNLREADRSDQEANKKVRSDNTSGFKGVSWSKRDGKWTTKLKYRGVCYSLGSYTNVEDAVAAVNAKRSEIHGQFARAS